MTGKPLTDVFKEIDLIHEQTAEWESYLRAVARVAHLKSIDPATPETIRKHWQNLEYYLNGHVRVMKAQIEKAYPK